MCTYEARTVIGASREKVWDVMSDVAAWPDWLATTTRVQPLDGEPLEVGHRFRVHQPMLRPATWTVTQLEPAHRFVWMACAPGLRLVAEHIVDGPSPSLSLVRLRFSYAGALGGLVARLFRPITEHYLAQEAASLKHKVEDTI